MEKDSKNKNKLKNLQYMYETKPKKMIMDRNECTNSTKIFL